MKADGTIEQTMLALLDLNAHAFIDGNINLLMSAQRLQLPDAQHVNSRTQRQALSQVAEQNKAWREGRSMLAAKPRQLDVTSRSGIDTASAQVKRQDSLKLVSAETSPAGADNAQDAVNAKTDDQPAPNGELAVIKENLDATRRENDELTERMADIQRQLSKLQQLVALKDGQLAALQAESAVQDKPVSDAIATVPLLLREPGIVLAAYSAPNAAQPDAIDSNAETGATVAAIPPAATAVRVAVMPLASATEQPPASAQIDESTGSDQSRGTTLMGNTVLLGIVGCGVLLLLLVALWLLARRNGLKEAELQKSLKGDDDIEFDSDITNGSYLAPFSSPPTPLPDEALVATPSSDALAQADIYIAYGRFNQAAELLSSAISDEPQRNELRLKLMEVYAELGDREGFATQEAALIDISGVQPALQLLKANYPAMASVAVVGVAGAVAADELGRFNLDQPTLDEPTTQAPAPAPEPQPQPESAPTPVDADDAFDFDLDELDFDLDDELPLAAAPASVPEDSGDTTDFDFSETSVVADELDDFNFDELLLDEPSAQVQSDPDEAFDLALDAADVDLDLERTEERREDSLAEDLEEFSLDLDRPTDAVDVAPDDFLLSLDDQATVAPSLEVADTPNDFTLELEDIELPAAFEMSLTDDELEFPAEEHFAVPFESPTNELDSSSTSLDQPTDQAMLAAATRAAGLEDDEEADEDVEAESFEDFSDDEEFDFLSGTDENATKLDLARAYIDMGDTDGARDILNEVFSEGTAGQQNEARELLAGLA